MNKPSVCCAICQQRITGHYGTALGAVVHLELMGCVEALTQRAEVKQALIESREKLVSELLAVVQGDGGQHTEQVGFTQSVEDAESVFHALRQRAEAAEAERDRRIAYDDEMGTLLGVKRHYQDGLEVGGETLRGAIQRVLAAYDVADKERAIYLARWEDRTAQLDELIEAAEKMRAERDALRQVDDAMVERAAKAITETQGVSLSTLEGAALDMVMRFARAALDAALAVQP